MRILIFVAFLVGTLAVISALSQQDDLEDRFLRMSERAEADGLADPFKGVTTNGNAVDGLFAIRSTGVSTEAGKYKGLVIMQDEQDRGLAMLHSLTDAQREEAVLDITKDGNDNLTEAFKDNVVLDYAGLPVSSFSEAQRSELLALIEIYVGNLREGHARLRMAEVVAHLDEAERQ